jgi:hypothetical protein
MINDRYLGRFAILDGRATRIPQFPGEHFQTRWYQNVVTDEARKVHVASFPGEHYSSEMENGQLHIYSHTDELGRPAKKFGETEGTSGIRSTAGSGLDAWSVGPVRSISELNAMNAKHYAGIGLRRRA